ncbi:uncharacterized protein LOC144447019 isoform X1 [Glandiceps talaboti]
MKHEQKVENKAENQLNGEDFHHFEPHKFKSKQCAKCFKTQAEHDTQNATLDKGIAAKVIDLKSFNVQNGFAGTQALGEAAATNGVGETASTSATAEQSNNLSAESDTTRGSHLRRQMPLSRQKKEVRKNDLSGLPADNSNSTDRSNIRSKSTSNDETNSESGSITDNTSVQLLSFKLKPVNSTEAKDSSSKVARISSVPVSKPSSSKNSAGEHSAVKNNLSVSDSVVQNGPSADVPQKVQNDSVLKGKEPSNTKLLNKPQSGTSEKGSKPVKVLKRPLKDSVEKGKEPGSAKILNRPQKDADPGKKLKQPGTALSQNKKSVQPSNANIATKKYPESKIDTDKKSKQSVSTSVTVNLKKNKSAIPVRKISTGNEQQHQESEIQRIAKNLRPISKTKPSTSNPETGASVLTAEPKTDKKIAADSESVDVEERRKIVESKSTFASETLSKTAFTVFSGAHKHDTLPKRLGEPHNRPSVKPLTKEDRNNSDPELFQSVHSEELQVISIPGAEDANGEVSSHSQSVTNSQISSEIFFGKPTRTAHSIDHHTQPESSSATPGSVVIVNADGTVNHFNPPSASSNNTTDMKQTTVTTKEPLVLPKEKSPRGFVIPYRVVDLESPPCRPYKVVDIVSNPPECYPDQTDPDAPPCIPESKPPTTSTHKDSPTKFPKPSFAFPGETNSSVRFTSSISPPPFPVLLHDEKMATKSQEKGYEKPSKVAIFIGSGGYDNLPKSGGAQDDEDDDLDAAIAVITGYDNLDQVKPNEEDHQKKSASPQPQPGVSQPSKETEMRETSDKMDARKEIEPTEVKTDKSQENMKRTSDIIVNQIDNKPNREKKYSKEDTLTMGYERPISLLSSGSSSGYETLRQKSVSDPDVSGAQSAPDYDLLKETSATPRSTSEHSLEKIIDDTNELPPSPRRRTSSMPSSESVKINKGHRRERSKTVEVVPTVAQEAKEEIKLRPKRVAPPPPPPTAQPHKDTRQRALSPSRIPEPQQKKQRALSPGRKDTRTRSPSRHPDAVTDSMPRYPPPPPPHNYNKKATPTGKSSGLRATSPTRAMSPPIAIPRPSEDPPFITSTPPRDDHRVRPTPIKITDPTISSSPPKKDDKPKLKFNFRKLLGKKRDPEPVSPERPVNRVAVHRWLNQQPYLSDEELIAADVFDKFHGEQHSELSFSIDDDLTSAGGLIRSSPHRMDQDMNKKRRAPRKPPPPPVRADETTNGLSPAADHLSSDSSRHSPALQKAYSLSPPSLRRLQEHQDSSDGDPGFHNTGAARVEVIQPKKPKRRGRNRTTGFEEISRRQAPPPPSHGRKDHIYDEIPYDKKRPAPMPPCEKLGKSPPAKPPRKLSFDERPSPAPRGRSDSNERMDDAMQSLDDMEVEVQFTFEETDKELHLKSALKHAGDSSEKLEGNKAPRRPVRIMAPDEEAQPISIEDGELGDPSYANLYAMLKQAAALAKRQGEKKRWSSSSDEPADSPKTGKRPVPAPRPKVTPVKIDRSTSPIMFPGNVRDKLSKFEQPVEAAITSQADSPPSPPQETVENNSTSPSSLAESVNHEHHSKVNDLNLNTLKRMATMLKSKQEEQFVLGEISWQDLVMTTEGPCCTTSDTVVYPVVHKDHLNKPLAVQLCTKPENNDSFVEGTKVSRSLSAHPNILQVATVFTDYIPESVLGIDPRSPKNVKEDEPGTSSPLENVIETSAIVTSQVPNAQADHYVKHSKEIHEFLPEKYEHDVCLLLLQLFHGIQHLDMYHIAHGELKMENLFLSESNLPGKGCQLLIGNFGSAKMNTDDEELETFENKRQEFDVGLMIYDFLHEKSPFVVKTQLITQDYGPSDLPVLPQLSQYSEGLNTVAGELLRRDPVDRLSTQRAVATLQCLLWGPPANLLEDVTDESTQETKLKTWLDLARAKAVNTIAEKHLAALFQDDQGMSLEDQLQCQFLSEITEASLLDSYKLLYN